MWRRLLFGLVVLAVAVGAAGVVFFEDLVILATTPGAPFDARRVPRPPDYTDPAFWSALPHRSPAADAALRELPARDASETAVDVFYVHPTSYVGPRWNAPVDDPALNAQTDKLATGIQATAFNSCCAVYAPRYRQANGSAFTHPSPRAQPAVELAYSDVQQAFHYFLQIHSR